jgi:hypothetical protein
MPVSMAVGPDGSWMLSPECSWILVRVAQRATVSAYTNVCLMVPLYFRCAMYRITIYVGRLGHEYLFCSPYARVHLPGLRTVSEHNISINVSTCIPDIAVNHVHTYELTAFSANTSVGI